MTLLVFLVILFGLFGMISTQYINQYRNAYQLWTKEMIFNGTTNNENDRIDLCSKIESYSRELCEINDLLGIVLFMLFSTLTIIIGTTYIIFQRTDFNLQTMFTNPSTDSIKIFASLLLTIMVFIAIPIGKITDYTEDEKELVKNLSKTKDVNINP